MAEDSGYFQTARQEAHVDPPFPSRWTTVAEIALVRLGEGIHARPVLGRNLQVNHVYLEPYTVAPIHQHPEEQIGLMLEGEYEFEMNGEKRMIRPGDMYVVPPNVPHGARTFAAGCTVLDIFSPPRGGFRDLLERAQGAEQAGAGDPETAASP